MTGVVLSQSEHQEDHDGATMDHGMCSHGRSAVQWKLMGCKLQCPQIPLKHRGGDGGLFLGFFKEESGSCVQDQGKCISASGFCVYTKDRDWATERSFFAGDCRRTDLPLECHCWACENQSWGLSHWKFFYLSGTRAGGTYYCACL